MTLGLNLKSFFPPKRAALVQLNAHTVDQIHGLAASQVRDTCQYRHNQEHLEGSKGGNVPRLRTNVHEIWSLDGTHIYYKCRN